MPCAGHEQSIYGLNIEVSVCGKVCSQSLCWKNVSVKCFIPWIDRDECSADDANPSTSSWCTVCLEFDGDLGLLRWNGVCDGEEGVHCRVFENTTSSSVSVKLWGLQMLVTVVLTLGCRSPRFIRMSCCGQCAVLKGSLNDGRSQATIKTIGRMKASSLPLP